MHRFYAAGTLMLGLYLLTGLHSRAANTLTITNFTDDPVHPAPGSLRAILGSAGPGDTIRFAKPSIIQMKGGLAIDQTGLTLQGPGGLTAGAGSDPLNVNGANVTLRGLGLNNVNVQVNPGASGAQILDNTFLGTQGDVLIDHAGHCVVGTLAEPNLFNGTQPIAVTANGADDLIIQGNTFRNPNLAVSESSGARLTIDQNKLDGCGISSEALSGSITKNEITGNDGFGIFVNSFGMSADTVTIANNTVRVSGNAAAITTERTNVTISHNTLTGSGEGSGISASSNAIDVAGVIAIDSNTVQKAATGIHFTCINESLTASITNNQITGNRRLGIQIDAGSGTQLDCSHNTLAKNGTALTGVGILASAAGNGVSIQNNQITTTLGTGISVTSTNGTLQVTGNTVDHAKSHGLQVAGGTGRVVAQNNTLQQNTGNGALFQSNSAGSVSSGKIQNNGGAGVLAEAGSQVGLSHVVMGGNKGAGIDLAPVGVTPNSVVKTANGNLGWPENLHYNAGLQKVEGDTGPGFLVEAFTIEGGARAGNPFNGEGAAFAGDIVADNGGHFVYPASGALTPAAAQVLTFTATRPGSVPVTSEFSPAPEIPVPTGGLTIMPPKVAFGTVTSNQQHSIAVTLQNTTMAAISGSFKTSHLDSTLTVVPAPGSWTLAPGQSQTISVFFFAIKRCTHKGTITLISPSLPGGSITIPISAASM